MTVADIFKSVKFVVSSKGKKSAVMVELDVWEQIVTILEDAEKIKKARAVKEEKIPWNVAKKELKLGE